MSLGALSRVGRAVWVGQVVLAFILVAAAAPSFAAAAPAPVSPVLATLDACAASLDSLDIGYERIAERCPGLTPALEDSGYAPWLPADWKRPGNELSAAGLTQLRLLLQRELAAGHVTHVPDVRHLAPVLAQLPPFEPSLEPSWEARLGGWLRTRAAPQRNSGGGGAGWLEPVAPPPAAAGYVLLALLVLGAALLASRELRLLAVRWPRVAWLRAVPGRRLPAAGEGSADLRDESRDPSQKLGTLLAGVAARLAEQGRLPGSQGLTARELIRAAPLPPELRAQLATLAGVSEQLAYAPVPPAGADIEAARAQGRQLLAQLEASS